MLVLSRKKRQSVVVECPEGFERQIRVTVLAVSGGKVTLGFNVEDDVPLRDEVVMMQDETTGMGQEI